MKKSFIIFLVLTVSGFMAFGAGCEEPKGMEEDRQEEVEGLDAAEMELEDGTYEAAGEGHDGDVDVEVIIQEGAIESVEVLDHSESDVEQVRDAVEELPASIVETGGTEDIDVITDATVTSEAILGAVENALEEAAVE